MRRPKKFNPAVWGYSPSRIRNSHSAYMQAKGALPYGFYIRPNGNVVMHNRDYCPIWERTSDGEVNSVPMEEFIEHTECLSIEGYRDGTSPWRCPKTLKLCIAILEEWGVRDEVHPDIERYMERGRLAWHGPQFVKCVGNYKLVK